MCNTKEYNRTIAETYGRGAREFADFFWNAHEFLNIDRKKFLESMPDSAKILDCGCGPGQDTEEFAKLGYKVTGIDITPEFIAMAKKRVPTADFIQMDMREINLPEKTFDGIWVSFSLLHIHKSDVPTVLNNFKTVMKSTGRIMIALHRGPKTEWVTANISGINRNCAVQEWIQSDLEQIIQDNGFIIEYSRAFERSGGRFPLLSIIASIPVE